MRRVQKGKIEKVKKVKEMSGSATILSQDISPDKLKKKNKKEVIEVTLKEIDDAKKCCLIFNEMLFYFSCFYAKKI